MHQKMDPVVLMYWLQRRRRNRRWYVRPLNIPRNIRGEGCLVDEMRCMDPEVHFSYFRMSKMRFDDLLRRIDPYIQHQTTHRYPISNRIRLAVTLRLLATGNSQQSVAHSFRLGKSTVCVIFRETLSAIRSALNAQYLCPPSTKEFEDMAKEFWAFWNFPSCLGAVDGKHVVISAPHNSGSRFFNYKRTHSVVLMAIVDAKYMFRFVDIGRCGRDSDAGIWQDWDVKKAIEEDNLCVPSPEALPGTEEKVPYMFVADDAFPIRPYLMKPFSGHNLSEGKEIFNYRLSRARRVVENAFGIMSARWRIFRRPIPCQPEQVDSIIWASVLLHNYLKSTDEHSIPSATQYSPPSFVDFEDQNGVVHLGGWRQIASADTGLENIGEMSVERSSKYAYTVREKLVKYFSSSAGEVPWQKSIIERGKKVTSSQNSFLR